MRAPSPAPIVIRQVRSAPARHHKKRGGRRHGGGGGSVEKVLVGAVIGGALLGYIEKNFGAQLPVVPLLGKKGVIAVGAYFIAKKMRVPVAYDVAKVAAGIAGYEFAQTGHVSGDELSGLAAQV
jgi:hypothetical protein